LFNIALSKDGTTRSLALFASEPKGRDREERSRGLWAFAGA
jgi:hypothetical protein